MKVAHLSGEPEASVTFRDGLGPRVAALSEAGERVERFMLPDAFVPVQKAVQERVARLQNLHHVRFARLRGFETAQRGGQPVIISSETPGRRLSDVLLFGGNGLVTVDIGPALQVTREVLAALSVLHDSRNVTHGSVAPERIVLSPNGRVVMVEHVLAHALDRLQLPRHQLWRDWRIATPPAAGPVRFDTRTDLAQTGVTVLALLLGRSLEEEEYPHRLRGLLPAVRERLTAGGASRIARELQQWLERLLPSDGGRPFASVKDAQLAFESLVSTSASSLGMTPARVKALLTACAAFDDAPAESGVRQDVDVDHTVAPPAVTPEAVSTADVEDVDIEALLRLAAELDDESDGHPQPTVVPPTPDIERMRLPDASPQFTVMPEVLSAAPKPIADEPVNVAVPPEPAAAPAVGLDALASERVSLHQQFADLLAQVAPAPEEAASEPAASSLVLDSIRWTFEPVTDGASTALVPWRDATADEHAAVASTDTQSAPVTTDVDAWLLTSLAPRDSGTDADVTPAATDAPDAAEPAVETDVAALVEAADTEAVTETDVADVLASTATSSPLLDEPDAESIAVASSALAVPAPLEASDAEAVADTVAADVLAFVGSLPTCADVVAAESPGYAAALFDEVHVCTDAIDSTNEVPVVLLEAPDAEVVAETLFVGALASDDPAVERADVSAAEPVVVVDTSLEVVASAASVFADAMATRDTEADARVDGVRVSVDAIDSSDLAPAVLVEDADIKEVAESVVTEALAFVESLPTCADVIAVDADAEEVAETVIAEGLASDEPAVEYADVFVMEPVVVVDTVVEVDAWAASAFADALTTSDTEADAQVDEVRVSVDAIEPSDPAPAVLVEAADAEEVAETVIAESLASDEPAVEYADVFVMEPVVVVDTAVEVDAWAANAFADAMATSDTEADAQVDELRVSVDAIESSDPAPAVLVEAADAEEVAETVIAEGLASDEPAVEDADAFVMEPVVAVDTVVEGDAWAASAFADAIATSDTEADAQVDEVRVSVDAIESSDQAPAVLVEAADAEEVAETVIAEGLASDEPAVEYADAFVMEPVVVVDTVVEVDAWAASAFADAVTTSDTEADAQVDELRVSVDAIESSDPAPAVLVEAADAEEVAETVIAEGLASDEPAVEYADAFVMEPVVVVDTAVEVGAWAASAFADAVTTSDTEADAQVDELRVSVDAIDSSDPAPAVLIGAADAELVPETFIADDPASDESPSVLADVSVAEPVVVADTSVSTDAIDVSAPAPAILVEAAVAEVPPSAPVLEEAQADVTPLPAAKPARRRRSRRKTRKSVEAEDVPPAPSLPAGLSLVHRDVPAWQPPADLRSVVADAARRAASATPPAPPVVPPVMFTPAEAEPTPPILPATVPAAVTVVADPIATEPDHGRAPEPEPRSRTIVVLRQQVNWRRTAAAAVIIALLETAAFGAAWWWVQPGAKGTLVVETSVPGVEVLIDGALVGHTPFHNEVRPGRHTLTLRRGGLERSMPVEINLGVVTTQTLPWPRPSTGALRVTSAPDGAEVLVGGRVRGRTPLTIDDLPAGRQTLLLRGPSGTVSAAATVVAGETAVVDVPIFAGWVQVDAAVELVVFIDGTRVGTSIDGQFLLTPGTHRIDVSNQTLGFEQTLSATVEPGRVQSLTVTLPEVPLLAPGADGAEVFVDGVSRGVLPDGSITVPLGTHEVVLRGADGVERRRTLTVRAGAPVSFD